MQPRTLSIQIVAVWTLLGSLSAAEPDAADLDFFEKKIRPVLIDKCYECHSTKAKEAGKLKGGLLLDSREGLHVGGDTGSAITPGKIEESLLIDAVRFGEEAYQMPPDGKLPADVIANFEKWVAMGAPDPRDAAPNSTPEQSIDWEKARQHWSLQPPTRHEPPVVQDASWPSMAIDSFILARMEAAGLKPSAKVDRRTLLRRVCFDLTGLPPTIEQQQQFLGDDSPDAYRNLIVRLLESPRYGERWGRHWLDVARYSEDNTNMGPFNGPYPHAWRYRDWVVKAINEDVPYDQFIIRQLATDFLPETGPEDHAALGFQGLAPSYHKEVALAQVVLENRYADEWEDRVDGIGRGLLGLTLACARCHNHKYDPVTVEDYYALAGVFASCRQTTRPVISEEEVAKTQPVRDRVAVLEKELVEPDKKVKDLTKEVADLEKKAKGEDGGATSERLAAAKQELETATKQVADVKAEIEELKTTPGFEVPVADSLTEEQVRVEEITKEKMKIVYYPDKPRDLNIFIRGDAGRLGPLVKRRFLQILSEGEPAEFSTGSGRLELARAIANRDNPLTARVAVNRVWMHHFGVGLVDTPSNFGVTGSKPSHPELLDDLAVRFMDNGWSMKWLHREIMLSSTYQQSATPTEATSIDPGNRLLSHFNRRRLGAEAFRDAVLAVSGKLDDALSGPSGDADDANFVRRTIYASVSRHKLSDTLQTFDFPDPAIHCEKRSNSTTPLQQMFVLNSPFVHAQAVALAERAQRDGGETLDQRTTYLHQLLFAREPHEADSQIAREFLAEVASADEQAAATRWQRYTHALLSSNEFLYVD
ncbi:MAG: DUF1553 domain-containing protein [Planctomycetota bacterium]|nr:DUF1553 domain-containing protein [Planctomycetota bacterium]